MWLDITIGSAVTVCAAFAARAPLVTATLVQPMPQ